MGDLFRPDQNGTVGFEELSKENGVRFWYARDLMVGLGYSDWRSFKNEAVNKAIGACTVANIPILENFTPCKRDLNGKQIDDYKLNRFACALIVMNGDIKRKVVAEAQIYFSQVVSYVDAAAFAAESSDRLLIRNEVSDREKTLTKAAAQFGVFDYGKFQNAGYRGMYNMDLSELKRFKGLEDSGRSLLDFMGKDELAANLFRLSLTEQRLKRDGHGSQDEAEEIAEDVGANVRKTVIEQTGKRPEMLPVAEDIRRVRKGLKAAHKELPVGDDLILQRANRESALEDARLSTPIDGFYPDCPECCAGNTNSHLGSRQCSSGSIASGGMVSHCTCDYCRLA